jgi:TRAP-type C4-dicarboxylate transport system permease small subunit
MNHLLRTIDWVARLVRWLVIALALVMLVSLALQVLMRYVFGEALSWSEELAVSCFSWTMLLAITLGVRDAIHVRMDLLIDRLTGLPRRVSEALILCLVLAFGVFLAWSGFSYLLDTRGMTSAAIGYPIGYLYAAAPVTGVLLVLFSFERILKPVAPAGQP